LEHSTNAAKNGSFSKVCLQFFFPTTSSKWDFLELGVVVLVGGNGRSFDEDSFLDACFFLGIPGKCSQENGTPEYLRGVAGLSGESSAKLEDPKEEEHGESVEEEENEGVL